MLNHCPRMLEGGLTWLKHSGQHGIGVRGQSGPGGGEHTIRGSTQENLGRR